MKRIYRLTALILVLLMLVNLSASATTTGIPLDELDIYNFATLTANVMSETSGEEDDRLNATDYTVKGRYSSVRIIVPEYAFTDMDYILDAKAMMWEDEQLEATGLNVIDLFDISFVDLADETTKLQPAATAPVQLTFTVDTDGMYASHLRAYSLTDNGDGSYTTEELGFANRDKTSTSQSFMVTCPAFSTAIVLAEYCDGSSAGCGFSDFAQMNGFEREAQLLAEDPFYFAIHAAEYHKDDIADINELICLCDEIYPYGSLNHQTGCVPYAAEDDDTVDCPWHFSKIPEVDQLIVFPTMSKEDQLIAFELLSKNGQFMVLQGMTEEEKKDFIGNLTEEEQDRMEQANEPEEPATGEVVSDEEDSSTHASISVPAGAFDVPFIMNAVSIALDQVEQAISNALEGMHPLAVFDISFEALVGGTKLQPNEPVQLTFTIDISNVVGSTLHVHHMKDNGNGTYTAESLGTFAVNKGEATQTITVSCKSFSPITVSADCDGTLANGGCGFADFIAIEDRFARAEWFVNMLNSSDIGVADQYYTFTSCAILYHSDIGGADVYELVCTCADASYVPTIFDYASLEHQDTCPWHFSRIPVEDQQIVLEDVAAEDYAAYIATEEDAAQREVLLTGVGADETLRLQVSILAKHGTTEDVLSWLLTADTLMMKRALAASSLDSIVIETDYDNADADYLKKDADLYYVRTGKVIASYKYNSASNSGEIIEPSCQLVIAMVDVTTGTVTPVAEATAAN